MSDRTVPSLAQRLTALWDYLGIGTAHVSAPMPGDVAGLVAAAPDRVAGLVLCVPSRLDPAAFAGIPRRVLMIAGDGDMTDAVTARALPRLPGAQRQVLAGYAAPGWADVIADRTDAVVGRLTGFLDHFSADPPRAVAPEGTVAGISYRIHGAGPALVLLPFFLAPSQWEPAIPLLARRFSVVTLGGRHVGGIAALEDRARAPSYRAMVRTLVTQMAPQPGETMLDIGSGSGALDRMVARLWPGCPLTAVDVNPFLQREAKALAAEEGLGAIAFLPGSAEALPFPDASFDCVFSVTVLEECDADKALREAWRVLHPGGRLGVVVRAIDLPQWWNLELPPGFRARAETPPQSVGPRGVADASLYRRMHAAGFASLVCFPSLVTLDQPDGPIWRYREDHLLSLLTAEETRTWHALTEAGRREAVLMMAHPMHCVVGTKQASGDGMGINGPDQS